MHFHVSWWEVVKTAGIVKEGHFLTIEQPNQVGQRGSCARWARVERRFSCCLAARTPTPTDPSIEFLPWGSVGCPQLLATRTPFPTLIFEETSLPPLRVYAMCCPFFVSFPGSSPPVLFLLPRKPLPVNPEGDFGPMFGTILGAVANE